MTVSTDADGLDLGAFLRPGDHIVWGQACGEPTTLVEALIAQGAAIGRLCAFALAFFKSVVGGSGHVVSPLVWGSSRILISEAPSP